MKENEDEDYDEEKDLDEIETKEDEDLKKMTFIEQMKHGISIGMTRGSEIGSDSMFDAKQKFEKWKLRLKGKKV